MHFAVTARAGVVSRAVLDPACGSLTHLVVEPQHGQERGHLVPVELVGSVAKGLVGLSITRSEFEELDEAEET